MRMKEVRVLPRFYPVFTNSHSCAVSGENKGVEVWLNPESTILNSFSKNQSLCRRIVEGTAADSAWSADSTWHGHATRRYPNIVLRWKRTRLAQWMNNHVHTMYGDFKVIWPMWSLPISRPHITITHLFKRVKNNSLFRCWENCWAQRIRRWYKRIMRVLNPFL